MHLDKGLAIALGCAVVVALSVPALGRPLPNGEPQSRAHNARGAQQKQARPAQKRHEARPAARRSERTTSAAAPTAIARPQTVSATMQRPLLGWPKLVSEARKYMGTNPTARTRLWCATFMNMVLAKTGYSGTNSDAARSFASYGRRISHPRVGAIAVLTRGKNGGHVGVVSGVAENGNPIIISGNHNKLVGEATYPSSRVIAYVMPTDDEMSRTRIADRSAPAAGRAGSDQPGIDSPIAELIAAIRAEHSRDERARGAPVSAPAALAQASVAAPQPAAPQPRAAEPPRRVVEQLSAAPHRVVQQTPPQPAEPRRTAARDLPIPAPIAALLAGPPASRR